MRSPSQSHVIHRCAHAQPLYSLIALPVVSNRLDRLPLATTFLRRMGQLRRDMGRLLGMRRTPRLEFRLDRLSPEQQAIEDALERLQADK